MALWILYLKKNLRKPVVLLSILLLAFAACFSFGYSDLQEDLPCAAASEYEGAEAEEILDYLEDENFIICDSREEVTRLVQQGKVDCGIVFGSDLKEKMEAGDLEGCADLLVSPHTCRDNLYSFAGATALFHVYAPYVTAVGLSSYDYDASPEALASYYTAEYAEAKDMAFEVTDIGGTVAEKEIYNNFPRGIIAICLFMALGFLSMTIVRRNQQEMVVRMTKKQQFLRVLLPQNLVLGGVLMIGLLAGCLAAKLIWPGVTAEVFLKLPLYVAAVSLALSLVELTGITQAAFTVAIAVIAIASLFICPLYWDIALYVRTLVPLRIIMIPYWYFII